MTSVLGRVPGVPETILSSELLAELPDRVAPAPWRARARGMFWWQRLRGPARDAAAGALPPALGDVTVRAAAGALISYADTPVGPYHEIIGLIVARRGARLIVHVPFIAVDSRASIVGGRANWALPKTLVDFTGEPDSGTTMTASAARWRVAAAAHGRGIALPFAAPAFASVVQLGPDGDLWTSFSSAHGRSRLARIDVSADGLSFGSWFPTGSCPGALATFAGHFRAAKRTAVR
jgi:hypothetical protein